MVYLSSIYNLSQSKPGEKILSTTCLNTHTCDVTQHSHSYAHVRTCRWHEREQDLPEEGEEVHDVAAAPRRLLGALFFISTICEQEKSSSDESVRMCKYRAVRLSVEKSGRGMRSWEMGK